MDAALVCFLVLTAMLLLSALLHAFRQSFKIALLKVTAVGWGYRFRITVWCKIMKKHRTIIHFTADLFLFWLIFEWNGGFIINYVKPFVMNAAQTGWHWLQIAWNYFVYLSPFGRNMAAVPNFKYALIVCTICTFIACLVFTLMACCTEDKHKVTKALTVIVLTILLWCAGFAVCYLIVKIPVWYKVLAALAAILANLFIGFLLLVVLMKIGEMLDA